MVTYRSIAPDVVAEPAPSPIRSVSVLDALAIALDSNDLEPSERRRLALSYHREMLQTGSPFYAATWLRISSAIIESSLAEADDDWCLELEKDLNQNCDLVAAHAAKKLGFADHITAHGAPVLVMSDLNYTAMYLALAHARSDMAFPRGPEEIDEFGRTYQFGRMVACHNSAEGTIYFAGDYWQHRIGSGPVADEIQVELDLVHCHEEIHNQQNASLAAHLSRVAPEIHNRMSGEIAEKISEPRPDSRLHVDPHNIAGIEAQAVSLQQEVGREISAARGIAPEVIESVFQEHDATGVDALNRLDSRIKKDWDEQVYASAPALMRRLTQALKPALGNLPQELLIAGMRSPDLLGQPGELGLDWLVRALGALQIDVDKEELRRFAREYLQSPDTPLFERQAPVAVFDQFTVPARQDSASVNAPSWMAQRTSLPPDTTTEITPGGQDFAITTYVRHIPHAGIPRAGFEWPQHPNESGPTR